MLRIKNAPFCAHSSPLLRAPNEERWGARVGACHQKCLVRASQAQGRWRPDEHTPHCPQLFNLSSPNTKSLNQGAAEISARLMYSRKSWWSANPLGTSVHVASRLSLVQTCACIDKSGDRIRIKGFAWCKETRINVKLQNSVMETTG